MTPLARLDAERLFAAVLIAALIALDSWLTWAGKPIPAVLSTVLLGAVGFLFHGRATNAAKVATVTSAIVSHVNGTAPPAAGTAAAPTTPTGDEP